MPEMDGLEATRRITAKWTAGERPRIVAMTAHAMQGDREQCLAAGMDDYVSKPIRSEQLFEALQKVTGAAGVPPIRHGRTPPPDHQDARDDLIDWAAALKGV